MAKFQEAYKIVHKNEGGYANVVGDKGGETYQGIARVYHPGWRGWALVDAYKAAHGVPGRYSYIPGNDLAAAVLAFYKVRWDSFMGDKINSQPVANFIYDFHTNSGGAVSVIQRVLNNSFGQNLTVDGAFGPRTLAAVNAVDAAAFHNTLKAARIAYVQKIADDDPTQAVHLKGWLARINSFANLDPTKKP